MLVRLGLGRQWLFCWETREKCGKLRRSQKRQHFSAQIATIITFRFQTSWCHDISRFHVFNCLGVFADQEASSIYNLPLGTCHVYECIALYKCMTYNSSHPITHPAKLLWNSNRGFPPVRTLRDPVHGCIQSTLKHGPRYAWTTLQVGPLQRQNMRSSSANVVRNLWIMKYREISWIVVTKNELTILATMCSLRIWVNMNIVEPDTTLDAMLHIHSHTCCMMIWTFAVLTCLDRIRSTCHVLLGITLWYLLVFEK